MQKVLEINGMTYVNVESDENKLFTRIYYVNRKKGKGEWNKGIPFINKQDAIEYEKALQNVLGCITVITDELVYINL